MNIPETKIALILYSLREHCRTPEDLDRTLGRVKSIGYEAVQVSGVKLEPEVVKKAVDKHGLYVCGSHEGLAPLRDESEAIIDKLKLWGCDFTAIGSPGDTGELSLTEEDELITQLEDIGRKLAEAGIRFGYHNHNHEFTSKEGPLFLRKLYERTDPAALHAEIDVAWVTRGGGDPAQWILDVGDRMPAVHFKDVTIKEKAPMFCEVGEGNLNWPRIIKACAEKGVRWYIVEQDNEVPGRDMFTSVEMSYNNLKKMGVR